MNRSNGFRQPLPPAAADAVYEARRAGLYYVLDERPGRVLLVLYAYNRVAGTVDLIAGTLTFPDVGRPVVRDIHPADAVFECWRDARLDNPPGEPWEDSWDESGKPFRIIYFERAA